MEEEIKDASGFYRREEDNLVYGPNFVLGPYQAYELKREKKDEYTYPIDGWYWFDSEEDAKKNLFI
jgi:hypothetical protein